MGLLKTKTPADYASLLLRSFQPAKYGFKIALAQPASPGQCRGDLNARGIGLRVLGGKAPRSTPTTAAGRLVFGFAALAESAN